MPAETPAVARLRRTLLAAANPGGWPYYAGKASRIEPTAWALVALDGAWTDDRDARRRFAAPHLEWLASTARGDGLLVDQPSAPPNFTSNGVAACALAQLDARQNLARLVDGLIGAKGISVNSPDPRQDNRLQGWPWMPDTFSWLEPTAWCVLALKKVGAAAQGAAARINEAERLIVNRTCEPGGWNYGNASAVGQDLRPYVPTTVAALLALQDKREVPAVQRSLAWLDRSKLTEPTAMALALASMCLRLDRRETDEVDARLEADLDRAERIGNVQAIAMTMYALSADHHHVAAFQLGREPVNP